MKKLYTFLILVGCCVQAYPQHQAASFTFNQPLSGGGHHYQARDFIDMEPGFEYEAITPGEEFVAEIVTSLIPEIEFLEQPISSNRPLDYNLEVGTIEGNFYVDLKGKATYKIPVELPPGTNGLKPDLEIEYKSTLTNSYLGVGWRLNGLYSITRSGSTFFYDGFVNGITMTEEDRFILDGERLIVVNGLYGKPNSEYRTANESFNRITLLGDQNDGTEWFIVESKEGIKRYYGNSPNSRQWLPNSNSILTWFLNRIEDNQGNYIDYYYRHDQNYTYIDKIEYTGNSKNKTLPQNTIQFFYSRYKHEDYFYLINDKIKCELLISSIHIQTNTNRSLIYSFDYYFNHFPLLNQIKLANNEEESFNSTVFSYHEPKAYYQDQPTLSIPGCFHKLGSHFDHGGGTMLATEDFSNSGRSDFISFNDNTPDFYNRHLNKLVIGYWENTIDGPRNTYNFEYANPVIHGPLLEKYVFGDFNGDGRKDIALALRKENIELNTTWRIQMLIQKPSGNSFTDIPLNDSLYPNNYFSNYGISRKEFSEFVGGDFNGDGKVDLLLIRKLETSMLELTIIDYPSASYIFTVNCFTSVLVGFEVTIADFDGDGTDEIMIRDSTGYNIYSLTSSGFNNAELILVQTGNFPKAHDEVLVGNFNLDKRNDLLVYFNSREPIWGYDEADYSGWRLLILGKNGFTIHELEGAQLSNPGYYGINVKVVTDIDGDGLSDIIDYGNNDINQELYLPEMIRLYYNRGEGFFNAIEMPVPESIIGAPSKHLIWGDFNGDGSKEFLYNQYQFQPSLSHPLTGEEVIINHEIMISEINYPKQLLSTITNGFNYKTTIYYNYMPYAKLLPNYEEWYWIYYFNPNLPPPYYTAKMQSYLVDSVLFYEGDGVSRQKCYYKWPIINKQTNNFMGFKEFITEINKGEKTKYSNHLFPNLDMMLTVETTSIGFTGEIIENIDLSYGIFDTHPGVRFTYLNEEHKFDYLRNIMIQTQNNYSYPDINYGNISQKIINYYNYTNLHKTETTLFNYTTAGSWCPNKVEEINIIHSMPGSSDIIKKRNFEYYTSGENIGLLQKVIINSNLQNPVIYTYDSFDQFGNLTKLSISGNDFDSRITEFEYDEFGRYPIKAVNTLRHETLFEYEPLFGNIIKQTDIKGLVTSFQYDGFGRKRLENRPDGTCKEINYNWSDIFTTSTYQISEISSGNGYINKFFDKIGQQVGIEYQDFHGNNVYTSFEYNNYGQLTRKSEPALGFPDSESIKWEQYSYDVFNRLNRITSPVKDISYLYSANSVTVTDNKIDKKIVYYYDASGNLSAISEVPDNQICYSYDAEGKLISTQVNQATYLNTYDDYGFPSSYWDMSVGLIEYEYNSIGNLIKKTDSKGFIFEYTYDEMNRLQSELILNGRSVQYFYDQTPQSIGNINEVQSSDGVRYYYTYDEYGRIESESELVNGETLSFNYFYNQNGQLSKLIYPNNFSIKQEYNDYGYLNKIIDVCSGEIIYEIHQSDLYGRPTEYYYGNNVTTYRDFNPVNKIISNIRVNSQYYGNSDIFNFTYSTCPIMHIIDGRKDNLRNLQEFFLYDNYKRLTEVIGVEQTPSAYFNYSSCGNILETNEAVYSYGNNTSNHAVTALQLKSSSSISTIPQTIEYTPFNKVSKILEGDFEYILKYGPDNSRKESQLFDNGILLKTKRYMKSFEKLSDDDGIKENSYIFAPTGLIAIHQKMDSINEQLYYVHTDNLGSILGLTDEIGTIVPGSINSFDAWGNRRNPETWQHFETPPAPLLFDRGYTGHEHLYAFNLINMNGRIYDPKVARFLSPDPFIQTPDFSQSFNRYSYCLNNPINLVDKSGYYWLDYDYDYDYDWEDPPDPTYWGGWKTGIEVIASFDDNYTTREIDYDWNDFYEDYLYEYASGQGGDQISMDASHNRIGFVPLDVGENYGAYQMANYRSNISVRGNQSQITVRATSSNTPVAGGQVVFRARASLVANGNTTYAQVIENGLAVFKLPPSQNVSLTVNGGWTVYYDYGGAAIPVFHPIFWPFSLNFTDNFKLK